MSKFVLENGKSVSYKDKEWPQRFVWYGLCTYWTNDWDKLKLNRRGIPVCPTCGAPGFQTTFEQWINGAKRFEGEGNKWYCKFLMDNIEQCANPRTYLQLYDSWKKIKGII